MYWIYRAYDAEGKTYDGAARGELGRVILKLRQDKNLQVYYSKSITFAEYSQQVRAIKLRRLTTPVAVNPVILQQPRSRIKYAWILAAAIGICLLSYYIFW